MFQPEQIKHSAAAEVMQKVNFASMHCALILSEQGALRCTALNQNLIDVAGESYSPRQFAEMLSEMRDPVVHSASTPEFKSMMTDFVSTARQSMHLIGDTLEISVPSEPKVQESSLASAPRMRR